MMESNNSMFAGRGRQLRSSLLNASEKRRRNKSLCSALVTPPSYPGYGKINSNSNKTGAGSADNLLLAQRVKHAVRRATEPPNIAATTMMTSRQQRRPTPTFTIDAAEEERRKSLVAAQNAGLPPPASFFNNAVRQETVFPARTKSWNDAVVLRQQLSSVARRSSAENGCSSLRPVAENGVGADSVEHLPQQQQQQQEWFSRRRRRRREGRANSLIETSRRRSMFADVRRRRDPYFNDEMLRALELERITFFCGSQDEDGSNGADSTMPAQPINRPESVLELARKFSSASAHQELERHKAGVQINSTRSSGDSASLLTTYLYGNNSVEMARSCSGPCTPLLSQRAHLGPLNAVIVTKAKVTF